jgi:hypothetical protein
MERLGELGARYVPSTCNYRAWVLRGVGRSAEATDLNERARGLTSAAGTEEPFNQGTLDLADGCLLAGDLDGAAAYLGQLRGLATGSAGAVDDGLNGEVPAMAWHQRERAALLAGRLALVQGRPDEARRIAGDLATTAEQRGSTRHARFARVVEALARLDGGEVVDGADLEARLTALGQVAGLEAWRMAAEVDARVRTAASRRASERRAARLVAATPADDRPVLQAWITRWLGELGAPGGRVRPA